MQRSLVFTLALATLVPVALHAQPIGTPPAKQAKKKPQAAMAAKSAFPIVKASDAKVKGAHLATDLAGAKKLVGKPANVVGTITKVYLPPSNKLVLLNFAKDYKKALVGAILAKDFAKFPSLTSLTGKKVLLSGKIVIFKGAPEVELDRVGAIALVK